MFIGATVGDYTHEWAVQIHGGDDVAKLVADEHNFDIVDTVSNHLFKIALHLSLMELNRNVVP